MKGNDSGKVVQTGVRGEWGSLMPEESARGLRPSMYSNSYSPQAIMLILHLIDKLSLVHEVEEAEKSTIEIALICFRYCYLGNYMKRAAFMFTPLFSTQSIATFLLSSNAISNTRSYRRSNQLISLKIDGGKLV